MPLKRFFGRGRDDAPASPPDPEPAALEEESEQDEHELPEHAPEKSWLDRAEALPRDTASMTARVTRGSA